MTKIEIRRKYLRALIEKYGTGKLAKMLGYSQASFLTQMAGPNPSREVTEKTARRYEDLLGLPAGVMDQPIAEPAPATAPASAANTALVTDVIRLVGTICSAEELNLPPAKFADIVALAYADTMEHDKTLRPEHIKQLVRLLK